MLDASAFRIRPFLGLTGLMFTVFSGVALHAQSTDSGSPASTLKQHSAVALEALAPLEHEQYEIGGGDELVVTISGRPELSGPQLVGPDGRITLPVVGSVEIAGLTREGGAKALTEAVAAYYTDAAVTIQISKYGSNHILVVGNVEHPGILTFDQPPTLLEAITRGGPIRESSTIKATRFPNRCVIYRGESQVVSVDLDELLDGKRPFTDIRLRRNDVLFIPADQDKMVSVLGQVERPGPVTLNHSSTLITLIAESGGLTSAAGNPMIQIVHTSAGKSQYVRFKDLLKADGRTDIALNDGDIVFVPKSGLASAGYFLQQIGPVAGLATVATFAAR